MKYCPVCETDYPDDIIVCPQDGATVRRPGERPDPFVGRVIKGRYRVERQLGQGGMGAVYLAEQLSVGRKVALKILRGDFARDDGFVARFRQEATLVAALNETRNPRVTLIHDFDQTEDGSVFIVMEWLAGRTLTEVIRGEKSLDLPRVVRLATQVCEGLDAAHRAGVIHRDVKPQNIMVLDASDDIKLMDFGIARLRDSDRTSLTRAGTMMGTPDYMSPEQIEGQDITDKTDIYSFGIVFYEMLTGVVPFRATTQVAVLTKQLREPPVPPTRLRPDLPGEIEAIILKALEKDPAHRQRDMGEIARALQEAARRLGDSSPTERAPAAPTIVVDAGPRQPRQTAGPAATVWATPVPAASETLFSADAVADGTVVGPEPGKDEGQPPRAPSAAPSRRRPLLIGGALAAAAIVAVFSVVYFASPPPPNARPAAPPPPPVPASVPVPTPPPVVSIPPVGVGTPEAGRPESLVAPPRPQPVRPAKPGPVGPDPRLQSRPSTPKPSPVSPGARDLRAQVEERLRSRGLLRGSGSDPGTGVLVEVSPEGVVTLRGILRDAGQRDEAARLARVAGVADVRLQINVQNSWN